MGKRIVFIGSPEFSVPVLKTLNDHYEICGVVTQPDKPKGRGKKMQAPPVKLIAEQSKLTVIQPRTLLSDDVVMQMREWQPDLIVVAAYGKILPERILKIPQFGCINVHASLLPRWRGASPIQSAIYHGDAITGVTIMLMDEGMDSGGIIAQEQMEIYFDDTFLSLSNRLSELGARLLIQTLPGYFDKSIKIISQNNERATYSQLITKLDALIDFNNKADLLERKIRAFNPSPGCFMIWNEKILKVYLADISEDNQLKPGKRSTCQKFPCVGTATDSLILKEVQVQGKKKMSGDAFLIGARDWMNYQD